MNNKWMASLSVAMAMAAFAGVAQAYPDRPITIVVPAPAAGTSDTVIRLIAPRLSQALGQSVVIENKPGAGGVLASQYVAGLPADGYTFAMVYTSHAINPALMKLPYDTESAFSPVAFLGKAPLVLAISALLPQNTAAEFFAAVRASPGEFSYGTSAIGGASDLGGALFSQLTVGNMLRVPYRGTPAAVGDLTEGRISMILDSSVSLQPLATAGKIRLLGVASAERSAVVPALEPIGKALPGFDASAWFGIVARTGTATAQVTRINAEINRILDDPFVRSQLIERGFQPEAWTSRRFGDFLSSETLRWADLVRKSGLKFQ